MARKLKTYVTSQGFFDLALAAPSMKAALETWGASSNLFHQGTAKEVDDPAIVAATMAKPGVVLQRPVGSDEKFVEHSELPTLSSLTKGRAPSSAPRAKPNKNRAVKPDDKAARKAAAVYEARQQKLEAKRRKDEAAAMKERERRERAIEKAQAALDRAQQEHEAIAADIEAERAALDKRSGDEDARWQKLKARLKETVRKAGS